MNVEIGTEPAQFPEKEYMNGIFVAVHWWKQSRKNPAVGKSPAVEESLAVTSGCLLICTVYNLSVHYSSILYSMYIVQYL
jgi:hypothetical protein